VGILLHMTSHAGKTVGRAERDAPRRRLPLAVVAARVVSIDYKPIVENAVAGLGQNTPDARREVYAQAKAVVKRHLQLMRLPDPIVELEKLALDLAIRNIEKRVRVQQSVEDAIREGVAKGDRAPGSLAEAAAALFRAAAKLGRAFASLAVALCLGPVFRGLWILLWPLRKVLRVLLSPVGLAATLPVAAVAVFVGFLVDDDIAYRSLTDGPAARWLSRAEEFMAVPKRRPPARERREAALEPSGDAGVGVAGAPPAFVEPPSVSSPAGDSAAVSPTNRGPTKVRPVRAEFAASHEIRAADAPAAEDAEPPPPDETAVCNDVRSAAERIGCARAFGAEPPSPPARAIGEGLGSTTATAIETVARSPRGPGSIEGEAPTSAPTAAPSEAPGSTPLLPPSQAGEGREGVTAPLVPAAESEAATGGTASTVVPPASASPASQEGDGKVAAFMESARAAARTGDLDRAVHDFGEAIKLDAKYADGYAERGQALFKMGAIDRAIADFSAAIQRNGEHVAALRGRGIAYFRRGTPDPALADINRAILLAGKKPGRLSPVDLFEALRYRIALYALKQQYDLAIADATAIIDTYGRDPSLAAALKASYGEAGAGDAVAAVYRDRATSYVRAPALSLGWKRRLNIDHAVEDLSAAIPLSSDRGFAALIERAKLNEDLGQHDPALADAKTALAIKPNSEEARSALRRLGLTPPPLPNAAAGGPAPAIPMPRPRPPLPLAAQPTAG
jgi:tetratricopeptide (TPR) repeat protein